MLTIKFNYSKNNIYSILIIEKKKKYKSVYLAKLGFFNNCLDFYNNKYVYLNKNRLLFFLKKGMIIDIKFYNILKFVGFY